MLRKVSGILVLALAIAMSSSANITDIWRCATVKPINTSVEQLLGSWHLQEVTSTLQVPQVHLCAAIEIASLETSNSGNKLFSFLSYKVQNGTERTLSVNETMEVSSEYPWLLFTRGMDHPGTFVAETDDRKVICLATCVMRSRRTIETFVFSRDENADSHQIETIRNKIKAAGIIPDGNIIARNRTIC